MPLVIENGRVTDIKTEEYKTIKVDQLAYAQNQCEPQVNKKGNDIVLKMPQEDNYAEQFPRQLLEFTIPGGKLDQDETLNETQYQKIIAIRYPDEQSDEKEEAPAAE